MNPLNTKRSAKMPTSYIQLCEDPAYVNAFSTLIICERWISYLLSVDSFVIANRRQIMESTLLVCQPGHCPQRWWMFKFFCVRTIFLRYICERFTRWWSSREWWALGASSWPSQERYSAVPWTLDRTVMPETWPRWAAVHTPLFSELCLDHRAAAARWVGGWGGGGAHGIFWLYLMRYIYRLTAVLADFITTNRDSFWLQLFPIKNLDWFFTLFTS